MIARDLREKRDERDGESSRSEVRGFQNFEPRTWNFELLVRAFRARLACLAHAHDRQGASCLNG
jgi:hypothetical protein